MCFICKNTYGSVLDSMRPVYQSYRPVYRPYRPVYRLETSSNSKTVQTRFRPVSTGFAGFYRFCRFIAINRLSVVAGFSPRTGFLNPAPHTPSAGDAAARPRPIPSNLPSRSVRTHASHSLHHMLHDLAAHLLPVWSLHCGSRRRNCLVLPWKHAAPLHPPSSPSASPCSRPSVLVGAPLVRLLVPVRRICLVVDGSKGTFPKFTPGSEAMHFIEHGSRCNQRCLNGRPCGVS
jgi:hypothetical protein